MGLGYPELTVILSMAFFKLVFTVLGTFGTEDNNDCQQSRELNYAIKKRGI